MVDTVAHWIDLVGEALTADAARLTLRRFIRETLRQGTIPTMQVIAAAEAGHQDADMALREAAAEYISRREEMPTEIANYVQRALVMPPVTYPPGRNLADTWLRDVGIAVIVQLAVERWRLTATRNRASSKPSAFLREKATHANISIRCGSSHTCGSTHSTSRWQYGRL
jgi:hypothetical protein